MKQALFFPESNYVPEQKTEKTAPHFRNPYKPFTQAWNRVTVVSKLTARDYAELLNEFGYVVVPVYKDAAVNIKNAEFIQTLVNMPEFVETPPGPGQFEGEIHYVKGGFSALGNPSSFHNSFVREVRRDCMKIAVELFRELQRVTRCPMNIEQIVDRMRVLRPKSEIKAESWHRDTTPKHMRNPEDLIYGGWISFDRYTDAPQQFSGFDKSHKVIPIKTAKQHEGFEKATADEIKEFNALKNKELRADKDKDDNWFILIPSGHMLIFRQEMIHEVAKPAKSKHQKISYRLFTGWRLTNSNSQFESNTYMRKMEVPTLKSGQKIRMWPTASWAGERVAGTKQPWDSLQTWSGVTFRPELLEDRVIMQSKWGHAGKTKRVIPAEMYGMNDVSIKIQAQKLVSIIKHITDDIPEIYLDIIQNEPKHWRERWTNDELDKHFIEPFDTIYDPYTEDEIAILSPQPLV